MLVDAKAPVSFFAYPEQGELARARRLRGPHARRARRDDAPAALAALADALGAPPTPAARQPLARPELPDRAAHRADRVRGARRAAARGRDRLRRRQHRRACSPPAPPRARRAHDWLCLTGGAIGQGLPVAVGAAVACPDRQVVALESDGSAMYTLQALWTQAREGLDVTTILFNNGSYAVLNMELGRVGAERPGRGRRRCSTSAAPTSTSSRSASGMGVPATRATTAEEFNEQLARALATPGPTLVEAVVPSIV